jgi:serine phosphatase RsbU (regulator of sigma subunit)
MPGEWGVGLSERTIVINPSLVLALVLTVFSVLGLYALVRGIVALIRKDTVHGEHDNTPGEQRARFTEAMRQGLRFGLLPGRRNDRRQGLGLRFKLALFTIALVLLVICMASIPLYFMMIKTQQEILLKGLWDRSSLLLEDIANDARVYLPAGNFSELSLLPSLIVSVPEVRYATITGFSREAGGYSERVWATNDPDILSKIDTPELRPGISRITDELSPELGEMRRSLNYQAVVGLVPINARPYGTRPEFAMPGHRDFLFFKPVMYMYGQDSNYFQGLIRLEVSIDPIIEQMREDQALLLKTIIVVALAVLIIGIVGAFILSSLIIMPIQKLVRHVESLRDIENIEGLADAEISINSHDEIALLGDTINDMTRGLAKAATAATELSIGREIQKKFLPLDIDRDGGILSSSYRNAKNAFFFGYYEGAGEISGDYFDYKDLDDRYYAIIKCDVAGKGIPAALIMIQVATMFLNYFKRWRPSPEGMHIETLVYQINGFIETMGFTGRFAAFTLCLFDSETGDVHFCNAGDNIIHIYDSSQRRLKSVSLSQTPAAGVLPNKIVESSGGYFVQTLNLDHGDILLLYTDGIVDSKRKFRDTAFDEIVCAEAANGTPHGNHVAGEAREEMGSQRVRGIINAVMNRETYHLHKWHNPEAEGELHFDFSGCEGGVEDLIMALIAVEKIFRCYRDPKAAEDDWVLVDKKVDAFLKTRFLEYPAYCTNAFEYTGNSSFMYYTHLKEDEQYDDLTLLGITRK